jgi:hypothetical protein
LLTIVNNANVMDAIWAPVKCRCYPITTDDNAFAGLYLAHAVKSGVLGNKTVKPQVRDNVSPVDRKFHQSQCGNIGYVGTDDIDATKVSQQTRHATSRITYYPGTRTTVVSHQRHVTSPIMLNEVATSGPQDSSSFRLGKRSHVRVAIHINAAFKDLSQYNPGVLVEYVSSGGPSPFTNVVDMQPFCSHRAFPFRQRRPEAPNEKFREGSSFCYLMIPRKCDVAMHR